MHGNPAKEFWGKYDDGRRKDAPDVLPEWHPLIDHCADVAAVAEALLTRTLLGRRLARLGGLSELSEVQVARLGFLAALHDLGKFQLGFQDRARSAFRGETGHVGPAMDLLDLKSTHQDAEPVRRFYDCIPPQLGDWTEVDEVGFPWIYPLLVSTFCHHGAPYVAKGQFRGDWSARSGLDPLGGIAALVQQAKAWFPPAFAESAAVLPAVPAFQHGWNGILNLADWIGSSRTFFPYSETGDGDRMAFSRRQAAVVLPDLGLDVAGARGAMPRRRLSVVDLLSEEKTEGKQIENRPLQAAVLDLPCDSGPSVTVLEAPTGEGKTEAVSSDTQIAAVR